MDWAPIVFGGFGAVVLGGLVEVLRLLRRMFARQADIQEAVLGVPTRQGVPSMPSMRDRFEEIADKVEILSNRPAMNGGFQALTASVQRLHEGQQRATDERVRGAALAKRAADLAGEAAATAAAADNRAREAVRRIGDMHDDNTARLDKIEDTLEQQEIRTTTRLAALIEGWGIDLEHPPSHIPPHTHEVSQPVEPNHAATDHTGEDHTH